MFIQNNRDLIRARLTARNIAPLMARIYDLRESLGAREFCVRFDDIVSVDFVKDSLKIPHPKSLPQGDGLAIDSPSLAEGDRGGGCESALDLLHLNQSRHQ